MSTSRIRRTIWGLTIAVVMFLLGLEVGNRSEAQAEGISSAPGLVLTRCEAWTPDSHATPVTQQAAENEFRITGNGTQTCCGGWQFCYKGVREGQAYRLHTRVRHQGLQNARDSLVAIVMWGDWDRGAAESNSKPWNYLLPKPVSPDTLDFDAVGVAPPGATAMTIRYRTWDGGDFREVTFLLRRPHLYGAFTDEANMKPLYRSEPITTQAGPPLGGRPQMPPEPSPARQR